MSGPNISYAYMSCPPYNTAAGVCAISLCCAIPYFFGLHSDSFPFREYGSYVRVGTFVLLVFNLFAGWSAVKFTGKRNCILVHFTQAILCFAAGCLAIAFNLAFGVRSASIVTCQEAIETACLESFSGSCHVTGNVRAWMGVLYLFSLAIAMCAQVSFTQSYMLFVMVQRGGWGLEFTRIEDLVNSSRVELSAFEGKSVSADQPTMLGGSNVASKSEAPKLVVTTESSTGSHAAKKAGKRQPQTDRFSQPARK